jgi:hypothetical protein
MPDRAVPMMTMHLESAPPDETTVLSFLRLNCVSIDMVGRCGYSSSGLSCLHRLPSLRPVYRLL